MENDGKKISQEEIAKTRELVTKFLDQITRQLEEAESSLGVPSGTLQSLYEEPDYIFLIKMIATIEPVLNDLIEAGANSDGESVLAEFAAARLQLDGRAGKIDLARKLDMLSDDDVKFIKAIIGIRNRYAHNIRNVDRLFSDFCKDSLKSDSNFYQKLVYGHAIPLVDIPNLLLKILVTWAFSYFLQNASNRRGISKDEMTGLVGFMASNPKGAGKK